jgi:hypothetical protein
MYVAYREAHVAKTGRAPVSRPAVQR